MLQLLILTLISATETPAETSKWVSTKAEIEFTVNHPFHTVIGKSDQGQAVVVMAGTNVKAVARVPVKTFDSGNANRDAHMLEIIDAATHPLAQVEVVVQDVVLPMPGEKKQLTAKGEVELRGVKIEVPIDLRIAAKTADTLSVAFTFSTSLDGHGVERPSLLFVAIDDSLKISGTLELRR